MPSSTRMFRRADICPLRRALRGCARECAPSEVVGACDAGSVVFANESGGGLSFRPAGHCRGPPTAAEAEHAPCAG